MGGPGFQDFVIEKPEHSPHYEYHLHDPTTPMRTGAAIYRFIVRSQPQPFMTTLDCADPSMRVDKRNETLTPLQALALLNNSFMVAMSRHFADASRRRRGDLPGQVDGRVSACPRPRADGQERTRLGRSCAKARPGERLPRAPEPERVRLRGLKRDEVRNRHRDHPHEAVKLR